MDILNFNKLKEALAGYLKVKIELLKLDLTEHISRILAQVIAFLIIFIVGMFALAFASVALANYLNQLWGNAYSGYLVIAGLYLTISLIILYTLKSGKIQKQLEDKIMEDFARAEEDIKVKEDE